MGMLDLIKDYLRPKEDTEASQPITSIPPKQFLFIKDTTPRAKPTNNLSAKASVSLINKVIDSAIRQGVPVHAALAETQKETVWGNKDAKGLPKGSGWINPMQYNARDLAPIVQPGDKRDLNKLSLENWYKKLNNTITTHPDYIKAVKNYKNLYANGDYIDLDERERALENIRKTVDDITQTAHIDGGVGYLKKMLIKNKGNLTKAFADYRGGGQPAAYHGRHVKELYDSLRKNDELNRLIEERYKQYYGGK